MELSYAPPAKSANRPAIVTAAGLVTTALALSGVYVLNRNDANVMGWYAYYVIPAGALLVGIAAACGYGIASWVTGVKIRSQLLWVIVLLQVSAYFAAQYIEFRSYGPLVEQGTNKPVGFLTYFDIHARAFAWKQDNGKLGEPLGVWGYAFRALEMAGFIGGSLIVPLALMTKPYCELCQMYMKTKSLAVLPASVKVRKVSKKDPAALAALNEEQKQAAAGARQQLEHLQAAAQSGDGMAFRQMIQAAAPLSKAAAKLPTRLQISLVRCQGCHSGFLKPVVLRGKGKQIVQTELPQVELTQDMVKQIQPN